MLVMKSRISLSSLLFFFSIVFFSMAAQTEVPSVFGDNMVLQQSSEVSIWGKDYPNASITITCSWGYNTSTVTDESGIWQTSINTPKGSYTPFQLNIEGSSTINISNILIGEVWFCSGQSNMEMPMKGLGGSKVENAEKYVSESNNSTIRLFNNPMSASVLPSFKTQGVWAESNVESVKNFSAIGYMFASKLEEDLKVPIGIIESAWGGTKIEPWIPKTILQDYDEIRFSTELDQDQNKQKKPTFLYNSMVHPFKDFTVRGILWYQGESNRNDPDHYEKYLRDLIISWRSQWNDQDLPVYLVQIAPYAYEKHRKTPSINASLIREAQFNVTQNIKNTGLVVTTDAGDCQDIHPSKKEVVAQRLVNWALALQYSRSNINYRSPQFQTFTVDKDQIMVSFDFYNGDHFLKTPQSDGFYIAGSDKVFHPAQVALGENNRNLKLYSPKVSGPVAVRYGYEDCFISVPLTLSGLPVTPFRTDDW